LRRACYEENSLTALDISGCTALEDLRGALNKYTTVIFSNSTEEFWHICVRDNKLVDSTLFRDMSPFPNIAELFIWRSNQKDTISIHSTNQTRNADIQAYSNYYTFLDLSGSLQNSSLNGYVDFTNNKLDSVNINGCAQIKQLYLKNNKLDSLSVYYILEKLDSFGTNNGTVDLTGNKAPVYCALYHISNLESRGWTVLVDTSNNIDSTNCFETIIEPITENLKSPNLIGNVVTNKIDFMDDIDLEVSLQSPDGAEIDFGKISGNNPKTAKFNMQQYPLGIYILKLKSPNDYYMLKWVHI
jgi:hypothetical protein